MTQLTQRQLWMWRSLIYGLPILIAPIATGLSTPVKGDLPPVVTIGVIYVILAPILGFAWNQERRVGITDKVVSKIRQVSTIFLGLGFVSVLMAWILPPHHSWNTTLASVVLLACGPAIALTSFMIKSESVQEQVSNGSD